MENKIDNTIRTPEQLIDYIIYGDIHEISLLILGDKCPSREELRFMATLDVEQLTRLHIAASLTAFFQNRLHVNGYLTTYYDEENGI